LKSCLDREDTVSAMETTREKRRKYDRDSLCDENNTSGRMGIGEPEGGRSEGQLVLSNEAVTSTGRSNKRKMEGKLRGRKTGYVLLKRLTRKGL